MATSARLDELKKKFDENPRRYFAPLANEYRKLGDLTQAIALCRAHLPNQPGHISGHIVLAQALYEARELGEARSFFEAALDLDPENLIALRFLGDIAREQGEPHNARIWYERVLEADPRNDEIAQLLKTIDETPVAVAEAPAAPDFLPAIEPTSYELPATGSDAASDAPGDLASVGHADVHADLQGDLQGNLQADVHADVQESFSTDFSFASHGEVSLDSPVEPPQGVSAEYAAITAGPAEQDVLAYGVPGEDVFPEPEAIAAGHSDIDDPFFGSTSHDAPMALGELEAVAEPSVDDWFGVPAAEPETAIASSNDPAAAEAFDDSFFPDLASATPVAVPAVAEAATFSIELPEAIDAKAPPPPYVRADEGRPGSIPTPPFLAALDANDPMPAATLDTSLLAESAPEPTPAFSFSAAPTPVDSPAILTANVVADEAEVAAPVAEVREEGEVAPEWSAGADAFDLVETSAPAVASAVVAEDELAPAIASQGEAFAPVAEAVAAPEEALAAIDEAFSPFDEIETSDLATVEAVAPAPIADEVEDPTLEVEAIEEPVSAVAEAVVSDLEAPEPIVADAAPALGMLDGIVTEDRLADYAQELAAAPVADGLVVEYGEFVPPAIDETPFIASSISVPLDAPDAYSAGAPTLSAHEPFPMEADVVLGASPTPTWSEPVSADPLVVEPIAGFVAHEVQQDRLEAPVASVDDARAEDVPAESPAFVTETMAELYLQQGFHDEALSIYRQLLAQQPDDRALRDRVAALERGASSTVVDGLVPRDAVDRAGQSVRGFFAHFARREPRRQAAQQRGSDDDAEPGEPAPSATIGRESSFSGVATREEALTVPDAPTGMPTLTQLFATGAVSGADEHAASMLASAFGGGEPSPVGPAGGSGERELSLEHLFRDVPARSSGAVTLDEFYEGSSSGESDPASQHTEDADERGADIEQFTAWLEGLKKK